MAVIQDPGLGPIARFLAADHHRLDALLRTANSPGGAIDLTAYAAFRAGLLKHIGMEEKILFPAAQAAAKGISLPVTGKLRLDHGALAALLVPSPTPQILTAIRRILGPHNSLEEDRGGVYEVCEALAGSAALLEQLRSTPEVRVHPHADGPQVMQATRRALERAGYRFDDLIQP